jgi:hypothetical protein
MLDPADARSAGEEAREKRGRERAQKRERERERESAVGEGRCKKYRGRVTCGPTNGSWYKR